MAETLAERMRRAAADRNGGKAEVSPPEEELSLEPVPWPDPPAEAAYHGTAGEVVRIIEPQTEADPVAVLVQILVMFGSAIGRQAFWQVENDRHHGNLYCCLVGGTSSGRKGTSKGRALQAFCALDDDWGRRRIVSGLSSGEGLISAVRDPSYKIHHVKSKGRVVDTQSVLDDQGEADKRLLVVEPEFGRVLRVMEREGNTLSYRLREAWDQGDLSNLTKGAAPGGTTGLRATGAHISIIGHVTPQELRVTLKSVEIANGMANRFLWVAVKRSKLLPLGGLPVELGVQAHRLALAVEQARLAGELRLDGGACELLVEELYPRLTADRPGMMGALATRAVTQVRRLAMLYALLDFQAEVRAEHLIAAAALWDYCERSLRWIFGESTGDKNADLVLDALKAAGEAGLSGNAIHRLFSGHAEAETIRRVMSLLVDGKLAACETMQTGGRPRQLWRYCGDRKEKQESKAQHGQNEAGEEASEAIPP